MDDINEQSTDKLGYEPEILEQALLMSEAKFRTLAETAPGAISIFDGNRMLFTNDAASAVSGYTKEELLLLPPMHLVVPEAIPDIAALFKQAERTGQQSLRYTHQMITKQDEILWVDVSVARMPFIGADVWLSVILDVTENQQTKKVLQEREIWYSRLVESSSRCGGYPSRGQNIFC